MLRGDIFFVAVNFSLFGGNGDFQEAFPEHRPLAPPPPQITSLRTGGIQVFSESSLSACRAMLMSAESFSIVSGIPAAVGPETRYQSRNMRKSTALKIISESRTTHHAPMARSEPRFFSEERIF